MNKTKEQFDAFLAADILCSENGFTAVLTSGAVRSYLNDEPIMDFDVFIIGAKPAATDAADVLYEKFKEEMLRRLSKYRQTFKCPEGYLYSYITPFGKIQLVTPERYATLHELLSGFDFTICMGAWLDGHLEIEMPVLKDIKDRYLRINRVTYPLSTMNRLYSYKERGYNSNDAQVEFLAAVRNQEFTDDQFNRRYID